MQANRITFLLLATLIALIGLVAFSTLQCQARQRAVRAEVDARREEKAARTLETPEVRKQLVEPKPAPLETAPAPTTPDSQRTEVDAKLLEILVQDETSTPVPEATIVLFLGEDVLARETTDTNGLAKFTAREDAGEYAIAVTGWAFARGEVDFTAGRKTVTLAEGADVAGTVLVDAAAPNPPMQLSWEPANRKTRVPELPLAVDMALNEAHGKDYKWKRCEH